MGRGQDLGRLPEGRPLKLSSASDRQNRDGSKTLSGGRVISAKSGVGSDQKIGLQHLIWG